MSRKLKRKVKKRHTSENSVKKPRKIKRFRRQRCAFVGADDNRCKNYAVGKSTLCKKHGGNPVIKENLIKKEELDLLGTDTKFDPAFHPMMFMDYSRMGLSDVEIAAEFKVSVITLRGWAEKYEMFNKAYEIGQAMHETWWLREGKEGLHDRGFNTVLFKFLTGNKLGYSEKIESKNVNMNVHGVLAVPDSVSEQEWADEDIIDVDS